MDHWDYTHSLRKAWRELDEQINKKPEEVEQIDEGCVGGVCSLPSKSSNSDSSGNTRVGKTTGIKRMNPWDRRQQELDEEEEKNTDVDAGDEKGVDEMNPSDLTPDEVKQHHDDYVHTGQEDREEGWTQEELNENMMTNSSTEVDPLQYFEMKNEPFEILIKARGEVKTPQEWYEIVQQEMVDELEPAVPSIPPTEGGYSDEQPARSNVNDLDNDEPYFPNTSHVNLE